MDKKIVEKYRKIKAAAVKNFEKDGGLHFCFFSIVEMGDDLVASPIMIDPRNTEAFKQRQDIAFKVGRYIASEKHRKNHKVVAFMVVSEAWQSEQPKDTKIENAMMPSEDPNRIEILQFSIQDEKENVYFETYKILEKDGNRSIDQKHGSFHKGAKAPLLDAMWKGYQGYVKV